MKRVLCLVLFLISNLSFSKVFKDISYGKHPKQKFDAWIPEGSKPMPLIIYIHGGGFKGGDKSQFDDRLISSILSKNFAFISLNYRFLYDIPLQRIMKEDIAYAIQYLKHFAIKFNIDKENFFVFGPSAGGGCALWLAAHDDLKDPNNKNLIKRESTKVRAIAHINSQFSYDTQEWKRIFNDNILSLLSDDFELSSYHFEDSSELYSANGVLIREDLNMINLIDKNDPTMIFISNYPTRLESSIDVLHHPKHARVLYQRSKSIGHESYFHYDHLKTRTQTFNLAIKFFYKLLN